MIRNAVKTSFIDVKRAEVLSFGCNIVFYSFAIKRLCYLEEEKDLWQMMKRQRETDRYFGAYGMFLSLTGSPLLYL